MAILIANNSIIGTSKGATMKALLGLGYEKLTQAAYRDPIRADVAFVTYQDGFWVAPLAKNGLLSLSTTALVAILQECEINVPEGSTPLQLAHLIERLLPACVLPIVIKEWQ